MVSPRDLHIQDWGLQGLRIANGIVDGLRDLQRICRQHRRFVFGSPGGRLYDDVVTTRDAQALEGVARKLHVLQFGHVMADIFCRRLQHRCFQRLFASGGARGGRRIALRREVIEAPIQHFQSRSIGGLELDHFIRAERGKYILGTRRERLAREHIGARQQHFLFVRGVGRCVVLRELSV